MVEENPVADKKAAIKDDLKEYFKGIMQTEGVQLDAKGMKKEGADTTADYIYSKAGDVLGNIMGQTISSPNFFPIVLDPNLYDQGALYQITPLLTYLESRGRRFPADTTHFNYIKFGPQGFSDTWIGENDSATPSGFPDASTTLGTAQMCFHAVPFSLSDLLGAGQSVTSRAQLMDKIQETLREGLNSALINGSISSNANQFNGLSTIASANTTINSDMGGVAPTVSDVRKTEANLAILGKGYPTFLLTDNYTNNAILDDMTPTIVNMNQIQNLVAGVDVTGWQSARGRIPIIVDPFSPSAATPYNSSTNTGVTTRQIGMYNERTIFMQDLITPSWVEMGKTKPLATDGWVVQATVMYNTEPTKTAIMYDCP